MASELGRPVPEREAHGMGKQREPMRVCPRCGNMLEGRQCKLMCERCGYYMSCSDFL